MPAVIDALLRSRRAGIAIAISGAAILGGALASEHIGGLVPCDLCYMQRYPFWVAIPAGLAAAFAPSALLMRFSILLESSIFPSLFD